MRIRSAVRAGGLEANHNEGLRVRSTIKAAGLLGNHNEALRLTADNLRKTVTFCDTRPLLH